MLFQTNESLNGGCSFFATKRISKTAEKRTNNKKATIQVWLLIFVAVMIMEMSPLSECAPTTHKQHNSQYDITRTRHYRHLIENDDHAWINSCTGTMSKSLEISSSSQSSSLLSRKKAYKRLRRYINLVTLGWEQESVNNTNFIPIDDIDIWSSRIGNYSFLAQVKPNSTVMLIRWHHNLQTYVGSFQYLYRKQYHLERKLYYQNKTNELEFLMMSARHLLCEIETAINATTNQVPTITPVKKMSNKLTHYYGISDDLELDLKFTKVRFYEYAFQMKRAITRWLNRPKKSPAAGSKSKNHRKRINSVSVSDSINYSSDLSMKSNSRENRNKSVNRSTLRRKLQNHSQQ